MFDYASRLHPQDVLSHVLSNLKLVLFSEKPLFIWDHDLVFVVYFVGLRVTDVMTTGPEQSTTMTI